MTTKSQHLTTNLKHARGHLSQAEFARRLGLKSAQAYQNYENKGRIPRDLVLLEKMATLANCSVDELLYKDISTTKSKQSKVPPASERLKLGTISSGKLPGLERFSEEVLVEQIDYFYSELVKPHGAKAAVGNINSLIQYLIELQERSLEHWASKLGRKKKEN